MQIPNFHDGSFDGFWAGPDKLVELYLRQADGQSFVLILVGVERLSLTDVKGGNLIFDLVFRNTEEINPQDIAELYELDADSQVAANLLKAAKDRGLQVLEINPSYGAQGLALFKTWEISQREAQPRLGPT
jgi:hypothetical protein